MIKGPKDILILILAVLCLAVSLVFLPWSELNFSGNFPNWLAGFVDHLGIKEFFAGLAKQQKLMAIVTADGAKDHIGNYAYSLFLFVAMSAAAIAIILIGREENTEKTILEVKK